MVLEIQESQNGKEKQEKRGKKQTILLNGEVYCRCYLKDLVEVGLKAGEEVDEAMLERLNREVFFPRAKRRSLYLLNKKRYTRQEMIRKLKSDGYPDAVVDETLLYLEKLRYVEDVSYANGYAFSLLQRCSEREVYQKMLQKGFEKELIAEALKEARETYYLENGTTEDTEPPEIVVIRSYLRKKGYQFRQSTEEKKKKMIQALCRKGFLFSDIKKVLGEIEEIDEMSDGPYE